MIPAMRRTRRPRFPGIMATIVVLALGLATVLLLGACDGGDDKDNGDSPTATTPAADETPEDMTDETPAATEVSDDGDDVFAASFDPCDLLTRDEVESATGVAVQEGQSDLVETLSTCDFMDPDSTFPIVSVMVIEAPSNDDARSVFELGSEEWESVSGVGEDAYWADSPFNSLEVLSGKYDISVMVSFPDEEGGEKDIAVELANLAVDRLP